ncbi:hypothetical protein H4219_004151 [Mycoemilia scoparia]|uniref:Uncharacterized protein n=1 Tax=Mycoemilia scoparia TaxID=417184 RepID=A0A9W7ZTE8_9FUNG|nr:hypothetical protein H4219_004151 [Mycoemilia scoparia]
MSLSPSQRDLALAGKNGIEIIDLDSPKEPSRKLPMRSLWDYSGIKWCTQLSHPGYLASTVNENLHVWNLAHPTNQPAMTMHHGSHSIIDVDWNQKLHSAIMTCSIDPYIRIWDLRSKVEPIWLLSCWEDPSMAKFGYFRFNRLASAHKNKIMLWDVQKGTSPYEIIESAHDGPITSMAWHREHENVLITASLDGKIKRWDWGLDHKDYLTHEIDCGRPIKSIDYTPFWEGIAVTYTAPGSPMELFKDFGGPLPIYQWTGGTSGISEFTWRWQGTSDLDFGINSSDYELITWGHDRVLRKWSLGRDITKLVGEKHKAAPVEEVFASRAFSFASTYSPDGFLQRTRREHSGTLHRPSYDDAVVPAIVRKSGSGVLKQPPYSKNIGEDSLGSTTLLDSKYGLLFSPESPKELTYGQNYDDDNIAESGRIEIGTKPITRPRLSKLRRTVSGKQRAPTRVPINTAQSAYIVSDDDSSDDSLVGGTKSRGLSMEDELQRIQEKYKGSDEVRIEIINLKTRWCILSVSGPWGDGKKMAFIRVHFVFPHAYPKKSIKFDIANNAVVPYEHIEYINDGLYNITKRRPGEEGSYTLDRCINFLFEGGMQSLYSGTSHNASRVQIDIDSLGGQQDMAGSYSEHIKPDGLYMQDISYSDYSYDTDNTSEHSLTSIKSSEDDLKANDPYSGDSVLAGSDVDSDYDDDGGDDDLFMGRVYRVIPSDGHELTSEMRLSESTKAYNRHRTKAQKTPFPRLCGGVFTGPGRLVCFFSSLYTPKTYPGISESLVMADDDQDAAFDAAGFHRNVMSRQIASLPKFRDYNELSQYRNTLRFMIRNILNGTLQPDTMEDHAGGDDCSVPNGVNVTRMASGVDPSSGKPYFNYVWGPRLGGGGIDWLGVFNTNGNEDEDSDDEAPRFFFNNQESRSPSFGFTTGGLNPSSNTYFSNKPANSALAFGVGNIALITNVKEDRCADLDLAKRFILTGEDPMQVCQYNANIAALSERYDLEKLWNVIACLYSPAHMPDTSRDAYYSSMGVLPPQPPISKDSSDLFMNHDPSSPWQTSRLVYMNMDKDPITEWLKAAFDRYKQQGDVQTLALMACVLNQSFLEVEVKNNKVDEAVTFVKQPTSIRNRVLQSRLKRKQCELIESARLSKHINDQYNTLVLENNIGIPTPTSATASDFLTDPHNITSAVTQQTNGGLISPLLGSGDTISTPRNIASSLPKDISLYGLDSGHLPINSSAFGMDTKKILESSNDRLKYPTSGQNQVLGQPPSFFISTSNVVKGNSNKGSLPMDLQGPYDSLIFHNYEFAESYQEKASSAGQELSALIPHSYDFERHSFDNNNIKGISAETTSLNEPESLDHHLHHHSNSITLADYKLKRLGTTPVEPRSPLNSQNSNISGEKKRDSQYVPGNSLDATSSSGGGGGNVDRVPLPESSADDRLGLSSKSCRDKELLPASEESDGRWKGVVSGMFKTRAFTQVNYYGQKEKDKAKEKPTDIGVINATQQIHGHPGFHQIRDSPSVVSQNSKKRLPNKATPLPKSKSRVSAKKRESQGSKMPLSQKKGAGGQQPLDISAQTKVRSWVLPRHLFKKTDTDNLHMSVTKAEFSDDDNPEMVGSKTYRPTRVLAAIESNQAFLEHLKLLYADILYRGQLQNKAVEVLNLTSTEFMPYVVMPFNQHNTDISHLPGNVTPVQFNHVVEYSKEKADQLPISCPVKVLPWIACSWCNEYVRGHALVCMRCGHGGHQSHMEKWFERIRNIMSGNLVVPSMWQTTPKTSAQPLSAVPNDNLDSEHLVEDTIPDSVLSELLFKEVENSSSISSNNSITTEIAENPGNQKRSQKSSPSSSALAAIGRGGGTLGKTPPKTKDGTKNNTYSTPSSPRSPTYGAGQDTSYGTHPIGLDMYHLNYGFVEIDGDDDDFDNACGIFNGMDPRKNDSDDIREAIFSKIDDWPTCPSGCGCNCIYHMSLHHI